jgi:hypothetical protein
MPKFVTKDRDVWPKENTEDQRYYHQVFGSLWMSVRRTAAILNISGENITE